jgi:alkylhydroperoxidase family enzyme
MPHIKVPDGLPGIVGLLAFKPSTGARLAALMHEVLRGDGPLSPSDRELIAAYVSTLDSCQPYDRAAEPGPEEELLDPRLRALLRLAAVVVSGGSGVSDDHIAAARAAGADDEEIHDTVLLAATFCMVNRYVDGLAASSRESSVDLAFSLVNRSDLPD